MRNNDEMNPTMQQKPGGPCNIGYPSETHGKPKAREISSAHNLYLNYTIH